MHILRGKENQMIDYEKLKEAHELTEKLSENNQSWVSIEIVFSKGWQPISYFLNRWDKAPIICSGIAELITTLKELTESKPKYKIDDVVWFVDNVPYSSKIKTIYINDEEASYGLDNWIGAFNDENLYPTKKTLVQSQIDYWQKMKDENDE